MVRPHLEYGATIWNPYHKQDIKRVEAVQRRATKQIPELKNKSYKDRLSELKLPTLAYRRMRGDMIQTYKIVTGAHDNVVTDILTKHKQPASGSFITRGHSQKLKKPKWKNDISKNFFNRRVVDLWNKLPEEVVSAKTINTFESRLDHHWRNLDIRFDFDTTMIKHNPFTATGGLA